MSAYRLAIYCIHVAWADVTLLARHQVTKHVAGQLYRALGSIGANLAEGYSRSSGPDRVRMFEYALGSARESVVWYRASAPVLGMDAVAARESILQRILQLLLVAIPSERPRNIRPVDRPET
jgi:four helix bundle protein